MEFGRAVDIDAVDFRLPDDKPATGRLLGGPGAHATRSPAPIAAYVGCPRWGLPAWVGRYYPADAERGEYLRHYGRLFNAVELNATYYAVPRTATR